MSVSGLCEICGQPDVEYTCDRCGKLVCDEHFDREVGYCTECAAELRRGRGEGGRREPGEDMPDGVDEYRF
jgi:hypothetical protein